MTNTTNPVIEMAAPVEAFNFSGTQSEDRRLSELCQTSITTAFILSIQVSKTCVAEVEHSWAKGPESRRLGENHRDLTSSASSWLIMVVVCLLPRLQQ